MEEKYWDRFKTSGEIEDYLYYKGMNICEAVINKYSEGISGMQKTGERTGGSDNVEWNGVDHHSYR